MDIVGIEALNNAVAEKLGNDGFKWTRSCPKGHIVFVFIGYPQDATEDGICLQCGKFYSASEWRDEKAAAQFFVTDYVLAWPIFWNIVYPSGFAWSISRGNAKTATIRLHLERRLDAVHDTVSIEGDTFPEVLCRGFLELVKYAEVKGT